MDPETIKVKRNMTVSERAKFEAARVQGVGHALVSQGKYLQDAIEQYVAAEGEEKKRKKKDLKMLLDESNEKFRKASDVQKELIQDVTSLLDEPAGCENSGNVLTTGPSVSGI